MYYPYEARCRSECLHIVRGPMSLHGIRCAGHEGAGVVVKLGSNVTDWKIGDRGGLKPLWDVCHNCEHCWNGRENYCQKVFFYPGRI